MRLMSSVRISRRLFDSAKTEAEAMHRSLAGQIEHWAELGCAVEALGLTVEDAKKIFYQAAIERGDPLLKLLMSSTSASQEVSGAFLRDSKRARQAIDLEGQRRGWVSHSDMSPFAGVKIKLKSYENKIQKAKRGSPKRKLAG